jgi:glycosyltransferase involved in cell wall biosynthesis
LFVDGKSLDGAIVVISDLVEPHPSFPAEPVAPRLDGDAGRGTTVRGGYLERLPLAAVKTGLCRFAEIWHHHQNIGMAAFQSDEGITRRAFPVSSGAPFHSDAMVDFIERHGAPRVLCVWGLGVSERTLEACADSVKIYNSIDVPALRVPTEVSRHFDLVLTGAQWQSDDVLERHPGMPTLILPVGPDFASPETFFPIADAAKPYDVIYVAAAQPYKRHDILFDAMARSPEPLRTLCVVGYGEDGNRLHREAAIRGLDVDFVGPPGVPHAEVNRLMMARRRS